MAVNLKLQTNNRKSWDKILNIILPFITVAVIVIFWAIAAKYADKDYVPSVKQILSAFIDLFTDFGAYESAVFYRAFLTTIFRSVIAFSFAFVLAFVFALLSYKSGKATRALKPLIVIIRTLPTIAIALLLVKWTSEDVAPMIVTFLVVFPTLYNNLYAALCGIDNDLIEMCKVFGVDRKKRFNKVIFTFLAPEFITSAGAGLTLNLKLMVAAEVLSQTVPSMGELLNKSKIYFEYSTMLALVLVTVVTGLIIELLFSLWVRAVKKW